LREGYLAVAPDLYHPGGKLACIRAMIRDAAARQGKFFEDIETARAWLTRQGHCRRTPRKYWQVPVLLLATTRGCCRTVHELTRVVVAHDVKEYPDAGHSFLNDHKNVLFKMIRVMEIGYHEPSAQDALQRTVAFFNAHLKT